MLPVIDWKHELVSDETDDLPDYTERQAFHCQPDDPEEVKKARYAELSRLCLCSEDGVMADRMKVDAFYRKMLVDDVSEQKPVFYIVQEIELTTTELLFPKPFKLSAKIENPVEMQLEYVLFPRSSDVPGLPVRAKKLHKDMTEEWSYEVVFLLKEKSLVIKTKTDVITCMQAIFSNSVRTSVLSRRTRLSRHLHKTDGSGVIQRRFIAEHVLGLEDAIKEPGRVSVMFPVLCTRTDSKEVIVMWQLVARYFKNANHLLGLCSVVDQREREKQGPEDLLDHTFILEGLFECREKMYVMASAVWSRDGEDISHVVSSYKYNHFIEGGDVAVTAMVAMHPCCSFVIRVLNENGTLGELRGVLIGSLRGSGRKSARDMTGEHERSGKRRAANTSEVWQPDNGFIAFVDTVNEENDDVSNELRCRMVRVFMDYCKCAYNVRIFHAVVAEEREEIICLYQALKFEVVRVWSGILLELDISSYLNKDGEDTRELNDLTWTRPESYPKNTDLAIVQVTDPETNRRAHVLRRIDDLIVDTSNV